MKAIISLKPFWSGNKTRGVGAYTRELVSALARSFPDSSFVPTSHDYYSLQADIVHFPFFDPFFLTLPLRRPIPTVLTIHDLIPLKYPSHFPRGVRGSFKWAVQSYSARHTDHIITDSAASAADISRILRLPDSHISVVPLAPAGEEHDRKVDRIVRDKFSLPSKYILYVGDINWNKNVVGLIESFGKVKDDDTHLVLVGKSFVTGSKTVEGKAILRAINRSAKKDMIHTLGYVESSELPSIYAQAVLYVQPSWDEGFGLPVLEAMRIGCPVALSHRGSLPEVAGEAAAYFDPAADMDQVISDLLRSTTRLTQLGKLGIKRVAEFSWDKTACLTYEVYEKVLTAK